MGDGDDANIARYSAALQLLQAEGQMIWTVFQAFLVGHTVFLGFLLTRLLDGKAPDGSRVDLAGGLVGLVLCFLWWAAHQRGSDFYRFRMAQAREIEPEAWGFLVKGETFADGGKVAAGGSLKRLGFPGRCLQRKWIVRSAIILFALTYAAIVANYL